MAGVYRIASGEHGKHFRTHNARKGGVLVPAKALGLHHRLAILPAGGRRPRALVSSFAVSHWLRWCGFSSVSGKEKVTMMDLAINWHLYSPVDVCRQGIRAESTLARCCGECSVKLVV